MRKTFVTVEYLEKAFNLSRIEVLETLLALKEKGLIEVEYLGYRKITGETWLEVTVLVKVTGQGQLEYSILLALVAAAVVVLLTIFGWLIVNMFRVLPILFDMLQ